jgi:hypothetical protein
LAIGIAGKKSEGSNVDLQEEEANELVQALEA